MQPKRIFYVQVAGWPTRTHRFLASGEHDPTQVSITFSGQIEQFATAIGAELFIVAGNPDGDTLTDGAITIEHWPKERREGWRWYVSELRWALRLIARARRFRADLALLDSGTMPFFMMALFRPAGMRVVPVLHNTLWPAGFRPMGRKQAIVQALDAAFFRHVPQVMIAVSPEAERQVAQLAGPRHRPIVQTRAQFLPDYFAAIPPVDPDATPFRVMFIGRVTDAKGVLDIPDMAARVEQAAKGAVHWTVCGTGDALEELRQKIDRLNLGGIVETLGWTSLEDLQAVYARSHVSIVPTRSGFAEGLAMTAVEAILAGRPIVTNPIVPALELLAPAAMAARSNDPDSHADAVLALALDRQLYRRLQHATGTLGKMFYDRSLGLDVTLENALAPDRANLSARPQ